jgi:hypothetical protein
MSWLKKLFGFGGAAEEDTPAGGPTLEYKGFLIQSTPFKAEGQWQLCGVVSQTVDGERKEHRFIRADKFTDIEQAHDMALQKGRLIIDQQAGSLFS